MVHHNQGGTGRKPIRSYSLEMSRPALVELLRALGVRERPLPHRFVRQPFGDPTLYMELRQDGVLLWQHPLSGGEAQILPLRVVEFRRGIQVDVLAARLRPAAQLMLLSSLMVAPGLVFLAGALPLIPLLGGILCGGWIHYRGRRALGLERIVHDNFAVIHRPVRATSRMTAPILRPDLISAPIAAE